MKTSTKVTILQIVIALIIVALGFFLIIFVKNLDKDNKELDFTHTRRETSITVTSTSENITTTSTLTTTTNLPITTTSEIINSTATTTTKKKTTTKKNNTTKKNTTSKKTTTTEELTRKVTNSSTDYINALDDWEWAIVNAINKERRKNNLSNLSVSVELRQMAEENADQWQYIDDSELKNNLSGFNNYANWRNTLNYKNGYEYFIDETLSHTSISTRKYLKYVGVGVIYKEKGFNSIPTYYYVIIYE